MPSPVDRNSSTGPLDAEAIKRSLPKGHWREVKPEELTRRSLAGSAAASDSLPATKHSGSSPSPTPAPALSAATAKAAATASVSPISPAPSPPSATPPPPSSDRVASVSDRKSVAEPKLPVASVAPDAKPGQPKVVRLERRQELEHHLRGSPTDLDAFMELGRIYRAEDRPADARRVFQQALQVFPEDRQLLWEYEEAVLARSLQQLREVTDIAKRLDTAEGDRELKRCQDDWACRRMDVCRARLARDPSLVYLRVVLAEAMYDAGLYEGAIEELQPTLDHDELSPAAYLIRGRCQLEMGKELEAMASLRAAALRRSVPAPLRTRVISLRLLCETAERLGVTLTLAQYRQHLQKSEQELAELLHREHGHGAENREGGLAGGHEVHSAKQPQP